MGNALSEMLPLAVAIAVSPVPILAIVFMLVTGEGRGNALGLLGGWALALAAVSAVVALLGLSAPSQDGAGVAIGQLVLAALLVVVIAVEWRRRPRVGEPPRPPRFMRVLEGGGPGRAFLIGIALIVLNAKDGALTVAAGAKLAEESPGLLPAIVCVALFTVVASITMIAPVVTDLVMGERATPHLRRAHAWLERHGQEAVLVTLAISVVVLVVQAVPHL